MDADRWRFAFDDVELFLIKIIEPIAEEILLLYLHSLLRLTAQMAKLVDALVSGTSVRKDVQVRVLFWAQKKEAVV